MARQKRTPERSPAFQFYPADWLASPKVSLMTPAQRGAYIQLLAYTWQDTDCSLPDDEEQLARLSGLGDEWLNGGGALVRECFEKHPKIKLRLHHPRLTKERKKQKEWREKSREGGRKSAAVRRSKVKGGSHLVESSAQPKTNTSSSFSSSPSGNNKTTGANAPKTGRNVKPLPDIPEALDSPEFHKAWTEWQTYRREIRKKLTPSTATKQLKQLANWGVTRAVQAIQASIAQGWTGLFEPRDEPGAGAMTEAEMFAAAEKRICGELAAKRGRSA